MCGGSGPLYGSVAPQAGGPHLPQGRDGKAPRTDRPLRPPEHGLQAPTEVSGSLRVEPHFVDPELELMALPILDIHVKPPTRACAASISKWRAVTTTSLTGWWCTTRRRSPWRSALKFYSSVRLDIRRVEQIKDGAEMTGNRTRVKVVKNKCSALFEPQNSTSLRNRDLS